MTRSIVGLFFIACSLYSPSMAAMQESADHSATKPALPAHGAFSMRRGSAGESALKMPLLSLADGEVFGAGLDRKPVPLQGDPPDTTPPTLQITVTPAPVNGDWIAGAIATVSVRAVDNPGGSGVRSILREVEYYTSPGYRIVTETTSGDTLTFSITPFIKKPGTAGYAVKAVDNAGNESPLESRSFRFDAVPPFSTLTNTRTPGGDIQIDFYATDQTAPGYMCCGLISGLAGIWYRVDDGEWTPYTVPFTLKGDRSHTVRHYAKDVAGNFEVKSIFLPQMGDANADGTVDTGDAVVILKWVVGLSTGGFSADAADINRDNQVDVWDAVLILRKVTG